MKFHQLSVHVQDLLSVSGASRGFSVKQWCYNGIFVHFQCVDVNFPCICRTSRQLSVQQKDCPSTFCASAGPSINCCEHFVRPQNLPEIFHSSPRSSVNFLSIRGTFHLLFVRPQNFHQILSAFLVYVGTAIGSSVSVKFLCICGSFHQLFVQKRNILSASVNFPFVHVTFGQLSVLQQDILSTSVNSSCVTGTFCEHFVLSWDLPLTSVSFPCLPVAFGQLSVLLRDFPSTFPVAFYMRP